MGDSLHSACERLVSAGWRLVGTPHDDEHGRIVLPEAIEIVRRPLFEILAGVIGYTQWEPAGLPIAAPKGVPIDASPEVRRWKSQTDPIDDHSHSFLTVAEIDAFDWKARALHFTEVSASQWAVWRRSGGAPPRAGVYRRFGTRQHVSSDAMDSLIADAMRAGWTPPPPTPYVDDVDRTTLPSDFPTALADRLCTASATAEWEETFATSAGEFWTQTMPRLRALGPPEHVRIVFHYG